MPSHMMAGSLLSDKIHSPLILWCGPRAINRTTTPVKAWDDKVLEQPLPVKGITVYHRASRSVDKVRTSVGTAKVTAWRSRAGLSTLCS